MGAAAAAVPGLLASNQLYVVVSGVFWVVVVVNERVLPVRVKRIANQFPSVILATVVRVVEQFPKALIQTRAFIVPAAPLRNISSTGFPLLLLSPPISTEFALCVPRARAIIRREKSPNVGN